MNGTPSACACIAAALDGVDRTAEDLLQQLARLRLREPVELEPPDEADASHVGEQVDGLGDERELLGPDREHQEDRARRVGADDVAEQPQAVVVGPLEVVDQHGERPLGGQVPDGDGAEVERAQEPAVGREVRERPGRPGPTSSPGTGTTRRAVVSSAAAWTASGDPRIERASRNGPRSSSSAVTAIVVKPRPSPARPRRPAAASCRSPARPRP